MHKRKSHLISFRDDHSELLVRINREIDKSDKQAKINSTDYCKTKTCNEESIDRKTETIPKTP